MDETIEQLPKLSLTTKLWCILSLLRYKVLVFLRLKPDWRNLDYAPPAFMEGTLPHLYDAHSTLNCCRQCGGGRLHKIHHVC